MIFLMSLAVLTLYLCFAHMSYKYMNKVNVSYFGESVQEDLILSSLFWPVGLTIFLNVYAAPLEAIANGKDWADLNIEDEKQRSIFNTYIVYYILGILLSFISFSVVNVRYYKMSKSEYLPVIKPLALFSLFWPFALPSFVWHYWKPIKQVLKGKTWEPDEDIKEKVELFTEEEMLLLIKQLEEESPKRHKVSSNKKLN